MENTSCLNLQVGIDVKDVRSKVLYINIGTLISKANTLNGIVNSK